MWLILLLFLLIIQPSSADLFSSVDSGRILQPVGDGSVGLESDGGDAEVAATVQQYWRSWLKQDEMTLQTMVLDDILLISQQTGLRANSSSDILYIWKSEWEGYEKLSDDDTTISMGLEIIDLEVQTMDDDDNNNTSTVMAMYFLDAVGGVRWEFTDTLFVTQIMKKPAQDDWKIAYHADSWGLDYDPVDRDASDEDYDYDYGDDRNTTFHFDYVYPVQDLERAGYFYDPILGSPELVSSTRRVYMLAGHQFILDTTDLMGHASIVDASGLPTGYAIFTVEDV